MQMLQIEHVGEALLHGHLSTSLFMQQMLNILRKEPSIVTTIHVRKSIDQQTDVVRSLAEHAFNKEPTIQVHCMEDITLTGPQWLLEHPIQEILKNAVAATLSQENDERVVSPITVRAHCTDTVLSIVVEDQVSGR